MSLSGIATASRWGNFWRLLARESTSGKLIPEIDGLRFVAIFSVILYHLNGFVTVKTATVASGDLLSALFNQGFFGVQLFFVISGFVIAFPFAQRLLRKMPLPPLRGYYLRRLTRLEPPYIINLLLIYVLLVVVRGEDSIQLLPHLAASLFYLHNALFGAHSLINGVAWSLEVECQFYLLAPLLCVVFRIQNRLLRRGLLHFFIAVAALASSLLWSGKPSLELSLLNYLAFFLSGFWLADVYLTDWQESPVQTVRWDFFALLCWGGIVALLFAPKIWQVLMPWPILGAYCGAFRGRWFNRFFCLRPIYVIGGMCYTIYLYHFFVISFIGGALVKMLDAHAPLWLNLSLSILLIVPPVLLVCAIFFAVAEKPFMRRDWYRQLWPMGLLGRRAVSQDSREVS